MPFSTKVMTHSVLPFFGVEAEPIPHLLQGESRSKSPPRSWSSSIRAGSSGLPSRSCMLTKSPSSIGHLRSSLMKLVVHALKIRWASGSPGRTPETSLQVRSVWRTRKKVSVCQEPLWRPPVQNREAHTVVKEGTLMTVVACVLSMILCEKARHRRLRRYCRMVAKRVRLASRSW